MKIRFLIVYFLLIYYPSVLLSQTGWNKDYVIIDGKILNFQNKKNSTINFYFRDIVKRELRNIYVTEIDTLGNFLIKIPIYYPQNFYINYGFSAQLICSPGDSLFVRINSENKTVYVAGGNRVKDNNDFNQFINGLANVDNQNIYDLAKHKTSNEFTQYVTKRESKFRDFLINFIKSNNTSSLFNQIAEDYLKYETWYVLLAYPKWHAEQNNISTDSVTLSIDYYSFLKQYDMDDADLISTKHADFLNQYDNYILQTPKDSMNKANSYFRKQELVSGARVLMGMIHENTSGFTRNLFLTKFCLDVLAGKQIKEFEAFYDSTYITDLYFRKIINDEYFDLQKFMSNQSTEGANITYLNNKILKNLTDTISSKYSDKVIYIDFWAPWCSPCLEEFPDLKILQQDYKSQDVIFLFLANRCEEDAWKATIANRRLTGEHILLSDDQYNLLAEEFGITGIPHYVLIDRKGNIASKNAPQPSHKEQIKAEIDSLLQ